MALRVTLIGHYPPPYGGVATLMQQMEAALKAAGCRMEIFNLGHGKPEAENVRNFDTTNRAREVLELRSAMASSDSDVFHYVSASYRSFWLGTVCLALAGLARKTMVVSFVGGAFPDFIGSLGPVKRAWARFALSRASALLACNGEIEAVLRKLAPAAAIGRMTNSFPMPRGERRGLPGGVIRFIESHGPIICTTGAAQSEYGLLGAIEAVAGLRSEFPDIGFVLVMTRYGTGEYEREIHNAIADHRLDTCVMIAKNLPDFVALLERADVFLRSTLVDGDSMSVREALYLGVPTVASDTAFRPDGVIEYRKGDVADMTEKLETALRAGPGDSAVARRESERNLEALLETYSAVTGEDLAVARSI